MKFLSEYRDADVVKRLLTEIHHTVTKPWTIMEICGGQTHSLVRNGILDMLPREITMVHGPGCPVCVTPIDMIDKAIGLALDSKAIICSFGDMVRVPGSGKNLLQAKAAGGDIRMVYSPLEALAIAKSNPEREVVFFAVGFETTAPANALSVILAKKESVKNFSLLVSHVLVPPAMEAILSDPESRIQGFLAAGHVCTVMGYREYYPLAAKYKIPIVVTGFEPVDLLQGIWMTVKQLEEGRYDLENQYSRIVREEGNLNAIAAIEEVFVVSDRDWRGIGTIPMSGYELNDEYAEFDASRKFEINPEKVEEPVECMAGNVLKGLMKPHECPQFGKACTPMHPMGAPMVSSEGACAAYYHYSRQNELVS
ncbi:hydrogenase formation protein HypD [Fulvivirga sedimenti]|uniref:Hydrogenase formation protein HypD n=1 Tax=Fulvivirga sedimenti TaxID=2879465 RepID=A0A9X1HWG1_9BACT|nr:hydrogenase formation protein HypD [Fulvivirga sedimenti]MCA6079200.1 hydrogenase formation protein HypD [Fulvivirga sedimenti]